MFRFECQDFESSIGTIDVEFDVEYDIISDETGTEYDWYADSSIGVTVYDDDGNVTAELLLKPEDSLSQEILKHYNRHIVDLCHDDYSASW